MARSSAQSKKPQTRGGKQAQQEAGSSLRGNAGRAEREQKAAVASPAASSAGAGRDIAGVALAVFAVVSFIAVVSPSTAPLTSVISQFYHLGFGVGAYVLPLVLLASAVCLFLRERSPLSGRVLAGAALVFCAVLAMLTLLVPSGSAEGALFEAAHLSASGGYLGAFVASALQTAFGTAIALVLLLGLAIAGLVVIGFSVSDFVQAAAERVRYLAQEMAARRRREPEANAAPWGDEGQGASTAKTTLIDGREQGRSSGQQRLPVDEGADSTPATTFLGARETSVQERGARAAAQSSPVEAADEDEDPLVDISAQLAAERAVTRLIPVKERYVEVEGPIEVPADAVQGGVAAATVLQERQAGDTVLFEQGPAAPSATPAHEPAPVDDPPAGEVGDEPDLVPWDLPVAPSFGGWDIADNDELPPFVDLPDDHAAPGWDEPAVSAPAPQDEDAPVPADPPSASDGAIPAFLRSHADASPRPQVPPSQGAASLTEPDAEAQEAASDAPHQAAPRAKTPAEPPAEGEPPTRLLPPVSMLRHNPNSASAASTEAELEQTAEGLQGTLQEFGLHARVTGWISGPTVTTFKVQPGEGERVSRISNLEDDIALSLAAQSVRIFAPIPGTSLVGIEIPNAKRQNVNLADVLPYVQGGPLELAVGRDAEGTPVVADLAKMPHLLIAGTTGSGKSVMINSIIMTLLMRTLPEDVRLIMVDPKRVELAGYNGLPHLYVPVVTEPKQAASALSWAVSEMERRLKVFERLSVRKISTYNEKQQAGEFAHYDNPPQKMPYLVIIIDELSDLMMVAGKDIEASIVRIAQLGRAAGIHLIVATQRPSSNVVTGLIKANITNRIAFNVATGVDSRVIIDQTGAEKLTGLGDMLFSKVGWGKPKRIQGCFVSDEEIYQVVDFVKGQGDTDYHEEILSAVTPAAFAGGGGGQQEPSQDDPLLWEAAHVVVDSQLGSTSGLQRRLKVGYARAGRIMDMLEEKGVVGPPDGSKPREVLLDEEGLAALEALEGPLSSEEVEGY